MPQSTPQSCALPLALPSVAVERLVLRCLRRMAAYGLRDAQAGLWALEAFGVHFRRPLVLLRAFVVELAQASERQIQVAPCCAMRMTADEGLILGALAAAADDPAQARRHLRQLTGGGEVSSPLSLAAALNLCLGELHRPLAL